MNMTEQMEYNAEKKRINKIQEYIPNPNFKPYISMLMCSRRKGNPDHDIIKFLESYKNVGFQDAEKDQIELLIKIDKDDEKIYREIINKNWGGSHEYDQPNLLKNYPVRIRIFIYERGEGRYSLHNDYKFLFSQRNPLSKFIMFVTDDCFFKESGTFKFLKGIKYQDYAILGDRVPSVAKYKDYRNNQSWRTDVSPYPIISAKLLEIAQNIGWQTNLDNWITLLHCILYHKYDLNLWERMPKFIDRNEQPYQERPMTFNPMEITNKKQCDNPYYFNLVEQQAKNIYLNFIEKDLKTMCETIQKVIR